MVPLVVRPPGSEAAATAAAGEAAARAAAGEAAAGPLSRMSFGWMTPLFELGNSRPLEAADLPAPTEADAAAACYEIFEGMWTRRGAQVAKLKAKGPKKRSPSLQFSLSWRFLGWRFVLSGVLLVVEMVADLSPAFLLNMLVSELEASPGGESGGATTAQLWMICAGLLVIPMLRTVIETLRNALLLRAGLQLRNALVAKIYRKVLRLSNSARQEASSGHIINVMANDSEIPAQYLTQWHMLWLPLPAGFVIGAMLIGAGGGGFGPGFQAMQSGFQYLWLMTPLVVIIMKLLGKYTRENLVRADARIALTNEVLSGIRVIKLNGWEKHFEAQLDVLRRAQLTILRKFVIVQQVVGGIIFSSIAPFLPIVIFSSANSRDTAVSAATAFTTLSLLGGLLKWSGPLFGTVFLRIRARVAMRRIQDLMLLDELPSQVSSIKGRLNRMSVAIRIYCAE